MSYPRLLVLRALAAALVAICFAPFLIAGTPSHTADATAAADSDDRLTSHSAGGQVPQSPASIAEADDEDQHGANLTGIRSCPGRDPSAEGSPQRSRAGGAAAAWSLLLRAPKNSPPVS